jgi:spore coat protein CotF
MPNLQGGFSDKDRLNDMLSCEKFLSSNWSSAANEMVQQELFQDTLQFLNETHNAQRQLFQVMQQKGWYQTDQASQQQVSQTASQLINKNQPQANPQFQNQY